MKHRVIMLSCYFECVIVSMILISLFKCDILSSSNITMCYQSLNETTCSPKIVTSITLNNNQLTNSQYMNVTLSSFKDSQGNYLNLTSPLTIQVTKSQVYVNYLLRYLQNFPSDLSEVNIGVNWPFCNSGLVESNTITSKSTCGFAQDPKTKQYIANSGGFCCTCSMSSLLTGSSDTQSRSPCSFMGPSQYAHCLKNVEPQYMGYAIGNYNVNYDISVGIQGVDNNGSPLNMTSLRVGPSSKKANNLIMNVSVIGDFFPSTPPQTLSSMYFFTPTNDTPTSGDKSTQSNSSKYKDLILDSQYVSIDGSVCNKVGTSYTAFNSQSSSCDQPSGSCLGNQIADLIKIDTQGKSSPLYLASRFDDYSITDGKLSFPFIGDFSTQLTLEIDASSLSYTTSIGKAKISDFEIPGFESGSSIGVATTSVLNTGTNTSNFEIGLECSDGVSVSPSQTISLDPSKSIVSTFKLTVTSIVANTYNCTCSLNDPIGKLLDSRTVSFNTTSLNVISPGTNSDNTGSTSTQNTSPTVSNSESDVYDQFGDLEACEYLCPLMPTFHCFIVNGCSSQILSILISLGSLLYVVALITVFVLCFRKCFTCCKSKS